MIETIFYFPSSQSEYNSAEISSRTISFVPPTTQGGAGTIYKNGVPYGKMTQADVQQMISNIFNENPYILPVATSERLGGIKIGSGFNISNTRMKTPTKPNVRMRNIAGPLRIQFLPDSFKSSFFIIQYPFSCRAQLQIDKNFLVE